jgi:hypothetical protein
MLDREGYLEWEAHMGFNVKRGGLARAAAALGVSPETIRRLRKGEVKDFKGVYSRHLALAMSAIAAGLEPWESAEQQRGRARTKPSVYRAND